MFTGPSRRRLAGDVRLRMHRCMERRTWPGRRVRAGGLCELVAANSFAPAGGRHVAGSDSRSTSYCSVENPRTCTLTPNPPRPPQPLLAPRPPVREGGLRVVVAANSFALSRQKTEQRG